MLLRYRDQTESRLPALMLSGNAREHLAVSPRRAQARFIQKGSRLNTLDIVTFAAAMAVQDEYAALVSGLPAAVQSGPARTILDAAPWVPRPDLSDVLGVSESTVRKRLSVVLGWLPLSSYEEIQIYLDAKAIFAARGGRDSRVRLKIVSPDDLAVPADAEIRPAARRRSAK